MSLLESIQAMNLEDQKVALAVKNEIPTIEKAIELVIHSLKGEAV